MSEGQRAFDVGPPPPEPAEIWAALEEAEGVDTRRVLVAVRDDAVVLGGAVASAEEADQAVSVVSTFGVPIVNRLQIDPALREGIDESLPAEQVEPADPDEVLVGDPDMLSGPEPTVTDDLARSLDENEPLEPPDEPVFPPTPAEGRRARTPGSEEPTIDEDEATEDELPPEEQRPAAADLSEQDLREAAAGHPLPALDPELDATQDDPGADPAGVDELGAAPSEAAARDEFPPLVPGTEPGPGAVGEPTTGGGPLGGTPATETGAIGADTARADPRRGGSGGVQEIDEPGPEAEDDPAIRDEPPADR